MAIPSHLGENAAVHLLTGSGGQKSVLTVFLISVAFILSAKMFDLAANNTLATPTVFAYVEHA